MNNFWPTPEKTSLNSVIGAATNFTVRQLCPNHRDCGSLSFPVHSSSVAPWGVLSCLAWDPGYSSLFNTWHGTFRKTAKEDRLTSSTKWGGHIHAASTLWYWRQPSSLCTIPQVMFLGSNDIYENYVRGWPTLPTATISLLPPNANNALLHYIRPHKPVFWIHRWILETILL